MGTKNKNNLIIKLQNFSDWNQKPFYYGFENHIQMTEKWVENETRDEWKVNEKWMECTCLNENCN